MFVLDRFASRMGASKAATADSTEVVTSDATLTLRCPRGPLTRRPFVYSRSLPTAPVNAVISATKLRPDPVALMKTLSFDASGPIAASASDPDHPVFGAVDENAVRAVHALALSLPDRADVAVTHEGRDVVLRSTPPGQSRHFCVLELRVRANR